MPQTLMPLRHLRDTLHERNCLLYAIPYPLLLMPIERKKKEEKKKALEKKKREGVTWRGLYWRRHCRKTWLRKKRRTGLPLLYCRPALPYLRRGDLLAAFCPCTLLPVCNLNDRLIARRVDLARQTNLFECPVPLYPMPPWLLDQNTCHSIIVPLPLLVVDV